MNYSKEEERAQTTTDTMNTVLEMFFCNILDCIVIDEALFSKS